MIELLEELASVVTQPDYRAVLTNNIEDARTYTPPVQHCFPKNDLGLFPFESFLALTVVHGVVPYVRVRAESGGLIQLPKGWWPLLMDALSGDVLEPTMVECLLDLGADPNFKISKVDSQTPWIVALTKVSLLYTLQ